MLNPRKHFRFCSTETSSFSSAILARLLNSRGASKINVLLCIAWETRWLGLSNSLRTKLVYKVIPPKVLDPNCLSKHWLDKSSDIGNLLINMLTSPNGNQAFQRPITIIIYLSKIH